MRHATHKVVTVNNKQNMFFFSLNKIRKPEDLKKKGNVRENKLLDVVDELLSHHNDDELLGQFNEAAARTALQTQRQRDETHFPALHCRKVCVLNNGINITTTTTNNDGEINNEKKTFCL